MMRICLETKQIPTVLRNFSPALDCKSLSHDLGRGLIEKNGLERYHYQTTTGRTKNPTVKEKKLGVVYKVHCKDCGKGQIGETAKTFGTSLKQRYLIEEILKNKQ